MIYLDNAATTRVFKSAAAAAVHAMCEAFYNPNATYKPAVGVASDMEKCRAIIADRIGAEADELIFTSCASESNNWALARARKNKNGNVVISAGEHSSVYEAAMSLKNSGVEVRIVPLTRSGSIDVSEFEKLVDKNTALISVIHVSNETGVINPISQLVKIARAQAPRAIFHSDGVQALLKTETALDGLGVDLYSASAHKLGAPKGIGLLYVRRGVNVVPYIYGGGQERGMRSGTQNTPYIAAFAEAVKEFCTRADRNRVSIIRAKLADYFVSNGCDIIGSGDNSGYILCVCVHGVKAEILQNAVSEHGIIIGKGAACSGSKRGNRVLSAMGVNDKDIECCIRISGFVDTTETDAIEAAKVIIDCARKIRSGNV